MVEKETGKYFKYAVGEIMLVVIGILIALQVNNLNEDRKRRKEEIIILNELVLGLSSDLSTLNFNITIHDQAMKSTGIVLNALNDHQEFIDSLAYHFAAVYYYTRFDCSRGAYESLKSKGFGSISNESLRFEIINLYDQWYNIIVENVKILTDDIMELKRNFNHDYFDKFQVFNTSSSINYNGEMIPNDFEQLKLNKAYKYQIRTLNNSHSVVKQAYKITVDRVEKLINVCKEEVKRLE